MNKNVDLAIQKANLFMEEMEKTGFFISVQICTIDQSKGSDTNNFQGLCLSTMTNLLALGHLEKHKEIILDVSRKAQSLDALVQSMEQNLELTKRYVKAIHNAHQCQETIMDKSADKSIEGTSGISTG